MRLTNKIKTLFVDAIKEHLISCCLFLAAMLSLTVGVGGNSFYYHEPTNYEYYGRMICFIFLGASFGALLCEAIHLYKKSDETYSPKNKKYIALFSIISILTTLATHRLWVLSNLEDVRSLDSAYEILSKYAAFFIIASSLLLTIFFFYKRSTEAFEAYLAKAFCGFMKAELVYCIIAIGALLVLWAFDTLIIDIDGYNLYERLEIVIIGLVQFPCCVVGLSKTDGKLSKFAKVVLSYVFTAIIAIAFLIIYIYIIKILITWSFPKNQVFTILTCLFIFGAVIWTMAQGACDEHFIKPLKIFPLLFIPFIILQIMCLAMRVSAYGYTVERYLGLVVIVFEFIYFGFYFFRFFKDKDVIGHLLLVMCVSLFIVLFMPGISMDSVVASSQIKRVEACLSQGNKASDELKNQAYSAYNTLYYYAGLPGKRYINGLSDEEVKLIESYSDTPKDNYDEFWVSTYRTIESVDLKGHSKLYILDSNNLDEVDFHNLPIHYDSYETTADLSGPANELIDLYKKEGIYNSDSEKKASIISKEFTLDNGDILLLTSFDFHYDLEDNTVSRVEINGYILH